MWFILIITTVDCDIIEGYLNIKTQQKCKRILARITICIVSGVVGYFAKHNLAFLVAVQGCVGSICGPALPLPVLLYLGTFWNRMNIFSKIIHIGLFILAVSIGVITTIGAIQALT